MQDALRPLGGHAVQLLLVQLALLLLVARLGSEIAKRLGLPAVVGELAAGIALGPSLFGHFAPHAFTLQEERRRHRWRKVGACLPHTWPGSLAFVPDVASDETGVRRDAWSIIGAPAMPAST